MRQLLAAMLVLVCLQPVGAADRPADPADAQWGWDDIAPASSEPTQTEATEPAVPVEEVVEADTAIAPDVDTEAAGSPAAEEPAAEAQSFGDWDWDGVEAADAGALPQEGERRKRRELTVEGPRVGETAAPDFSAEVKPGQALFAGVPDFMVVPSVKDPAMFPCADCHAWAQSNLEPRPLQNPHDNFTLQHGLHGHGEFWCFSCHHLEGDGGIQTLEGDKFGFDQAYLVCAQCHAEQARDWSFGAHGKRVANWQGERQLLNCTACHYQHNPTIKPRAPLPPPPVRRGLSRSHHKPEPAPKLWERYAARRKESR